VRRRALAPVRTPPTAAPARQERAAAAAEAAAAQGGAAAALLSARLEAAEARAAAREHAVCELTRCAGGRCLSLLSACCCSLTAHSAGVAVAAPLP